MALINKLALLFYLQLILCSIVSCQVHDSNIEFSRSKSLFLKVFNEDSLFSHFPRTIDNNSVVSGHFSPPQENHCFGEMVLVYSLNNDILTFIDKQKFVLIDSICSKSFIILKYDFVTDSLYNTIHRSDTCFKYPIADLHQSNYYLGEINDSTFINDEKVYVPIPKYKVPDDLKIFLLDAKPGSFWLVDCAEYRSPYLGCKWRNGYSRGYAISNKENLIVFWAVVW